MKRTLESEREDLRVARVKPSNKTKDSQFYRSTTGVRPTPGPPAINAKLRDRDTYLSRNGLVVPEAYKQFLRIQNGIEVPHPERAISSRSTSRSPP